MTLASLGAINSTTYLALGALCLVVIGVTLLRRTPYRSGARRTIARTRRNRRNQPVEVRQSPTARPAEKRLTTTTTTDDGAPAACPEWRQRVFDLADAGSTPISIAGAVQAPLGEVELLLSLRRFEQNSVSDFAQPRTTRFSLGSNASTTA